MSWLSRGLKKTEQYIASKIPHTTAAEKRASMEVTKSQIDYYNQAKADATELKNKNEETKKEERRKINEKEIRARKSTFRRGGFLETPQPGPAEKLG